MPADPRPKRQVVVVVMNSTATPLRASPDRRPHVPSPRPLTLPTPQAGRPYPRRG